MKSWLDELLDVGLLLGHGEDLGEEVSDVLLSRNVSKTNKLEALELTCPEVSDVDVARGVVEDFRGAQSDAGGVVLVDGDRGYIKTQLVE